MADYYVDPSLGTDSGAGTIGDPWGHTGNEIQKAMDNITQGATGDTIHIKSSGTVSFGGTALNFGTYGTTTNEKVLGFSGYTSAAWDGGVGVIDLGGAGGFVPNTVDGLFFGDLDISGGTGSWQIDADNNITVYRCKIDGGAATGGITADQNVLITHCEITNLSGEGTSIATGAVDNCFITQNSNNDAIGGTGSVITNNLVIITHTGNSGAILVNSDRCYCVGNTVYSSVASTGIGFEITAASEGGIVRNNYAEGLSGTGGDGFEVKSSGVLHIYHANRWFNCTTGETLSGTVIFDSDNSVTTASGLTAAGSADYTPTSELVGAGIPTGFLNLSGNAREVDIGAIQAVCSGGSSGSINRGLLTGGRL